MSARAARTAQDMLRASVGSMNAMQLTLAAGAIGVSRATLTAFGEGRTSLPEHCVKRLGDHLYRRAYLVKRELRA
jgi:hypothetical protein